jgi:hypothetical protein
MGNPAGIRPGASEPTLPLRRQHVKTNSCRQTPLFRHRHAKTQACLSAALRVESPETAPRDSRPDQARSAIEPDVKGPVRPSGSAAEM